MPAFLIGGDIGAALFRVALLLCLLALLRVLLGIKAELYRWRVGDTSRIENNPWMGPKHSNAVRGR